MRFLFIIFAIFAFSTLLFSSQISTFKVEGMHCPLCTSAVKKAIKKLDGIENLSVRLNTKEVIVIYDEKVTVQQIQEAIKTTSYEGDEISTSIYLKEK